MRRERDILREVNIGWHTHTHTHRAGGEAGWSHIKLYGSCSTYIYGHFPNTIHDHVNVIDNDHEKRSMWNEKESKHWSVSRSIWRWNGSEICGSNLESWSGHNTQYWTKLSLIGLQLHPQILKHIVHASMLLHSSLYISMYTIHTYIHTHTLRGVAICDWIPPPIPNHDPPLYSSVTSNVCTAVALTQDTGLLDILYTKTCCTAQTELTQSLKRMEKLYGVEINLRIPYAWNGSPKG